MILKKKEWREHNRGKGNQTTEIVKVLDSYHRKLGVSTKPLRETLQHIANGEPIVETGQQPVIFGGPGLVYNKVACAYYIGQVSGVQPVFFVADYDQIQPELVNIHIPGVGHEGFLLQLKRDPQYFDSPISEIPLPDQEWLDEWLEKIERNYRLLYSDLKTLEKSLLDERLDRIKSLLGATFLRSTTVSEWFMQIYGNLVMLEAKLPVPILPFSEIRELALNAFEYLTKGDVRDRLIAGFNAARTELLALKYEPGYGIREKGYCPFTYESPIEDDHKTRIIPIISETNSGRMLITAKSPKTKNVFEIETNPSAPDLSDWCEGLAPRVDTRQLIMNQLLPIAFHVMGPGETNYYAQVYFAFKSAELNTSMPIFYKYSRCFYNSSWNENLGEKITALGGQPLIQKGLFKILKDLRVNRKAKRKEALKSNYIALANLLTETKAGLKGFVEELIADGKKAHDEKNRKKYADITEKINHVKKYLTNQFGAFSDEKNAQESSFSWIDLALNTGLQDYVKTYIRQYDPLTPPGIMTFINTTLPTCPK